MTSEATLVISDLDKAYPGGAVGAVGVNLEVESGQFVTLFGQSGSGKTSILHMAGLLLQPDSGTVELEGVRIDAVDEAEGARIRRSKLGFVFQSPALLSLLSAAENVDVSLRMIGVSGRDVRPRVQAALDAVDMGGRIDHRPDELSGGEQQRVAIARALVHEPALLIADEPTGELDTATGAAILRLLRRVADNGTAVLMASHDPAALEVVDRAMFVADGRISEPPLGEVRDWLRSGAQIRIES